MGEGSEETVGAAVGELAFVLVLGSRVEGFRFRIERQGKGFILQLSMTGLGVRAVAAAVGKIS